MPYIRDKQLQKVFTQRVIGLALRQIAEWRKQNIGLPIAVKIDDESLTDTEFANHVRDLLATHQVRPEQLSFEIDESSLVLNPTRIRETLSELKQIGIAITVRNFGSVRGGSIGWIGGAGSAVTDVKINRRYILDIPNNQNYFTYVQALIDVARALKLRIGADGVESEALWSELKTLGCDYATGYYLSRPVTADEFAQWYENNNKVAYLHHRH
jgi:EAL domain-containing protein (putative c-di-GMP-specific phosphodiesterase class I)